MGKESKFKDRWVLVTGAAAGIGFCAAIRYAKGGANIILTDFNEGALDDARKKIEAVGAQCLTYVCDVSSVESVQACADAVHEKVPAVDVLLNNAGMYYLGGFIETPIEVWQRMYQVNVMGIVNMIRAFLPAMKQAGGKREIINVASAASWFPAPNAAAYGMSKHAVLGLSETLAMELGNSNVKVMIVCPGIINTALLQKSNTGSNITERQLQTQKDYYLNEGCSPDVVAQGIVDKTFSGSSYVLVGPKAKLANFISRLSRKLTRKVMVAEAYKNGYLDADVV